MTIKRLNNDEYLLQLAMGLEEEHRQRTGHRYEKRLEGVAMAAVCPTCTRLEKLFIESQTRMMAHGQEWNR